MHRRFLVSFPKETSLAVFILLSYMCLSTSLNQTDYENVILQNFSNHNYFRKYRPLSSHSELANQEILQQTANFRILYPEGSNSLQQDYTRHHRLTVLQVFVASPSLTETLRITTCLLSQSKSYSRQANWLFHISQLQV